MSLRQGRFYLAGLMLLCSTCSFAWSHEWSLGYGYGQELNRSYNNSGVIADYIYLNKQIDPKLHFLLDVNMAWWRADTKSNENLVTFTTGIMFRAYFVNPYRNRYRPFIQVAVGPTYLSEKTFGTKTQGMKFVFQDRFGAGFELGPQQHAWMFSLQFIHYSNADLKKPNPGFNIPIIGSIGYEV